jgi:hypothetical protein
MLRLTVSPPEATSRDCKVNLGQQPRPQPPAPGGEAGRRRRSDGFALGADADRSCFIAVDFHHLAGLPAHAP